MGQVCGAADTSSERDFESKEMRSLTVGVLSLLMLFAWITARRSVPLRTQRSRPFVCKMRRHLRYGFANLFDRWCAHARWCFIFAALVVNAFVYPGYLSLVCLGYKVEPRSLRP